MVRLDHAVLRAPDRVAAVHRARQTAPGMPVPFDAVARMAARLTRAPTAVVTLVCDDHDDLLGAFGLPTRYAPARRWPPQYSLCRYVISHGAPLAVPDVTLDGRLHAHPLVQDAAVSAFAGVPLHDDRGRPVGALTVADITARPWEPADLDALTEIAALLEPISTQLDAAAGMAVLGESGAPQGSAPAGSVSAAVEADVQRGFIAALMDSLPIGVVAFGADRRPVVCNRALRELSDQPPHTPIETVMASLADRLRHPDGTPMSWTELPAIQAVSGRTVRDAEAVLHRPDGPNRHLRGTAAPIVASSGEHLGAVGTVMDVTAHRRAQDAAQAQGRVAILLNRADSLPPVLPEVLCTMAQAMGWPHASLWLVDEVAGVLRREGRWDTTAVAGDDPGTVRPGQGLIGCAWQRHRALTSYDASGLWAAPTEDHRPASPRRCSAVAAPIREGDIVIGVLACLTPTAGADHADDVAQLESTGEQIGHFTARRRVADLGQQLLRTKDDFVALVGHELRTPVTSIAGAVEMLRSDGLDDDTPRLLDTISRNADALRQIISDLLDMAQLESEPHPVRFDTVDLAALVATATAAATAAGSGPRLHTHLPPAVEIDGDPDRLAQVVDNLLSNAIKYTPAGGDVHLSLELDGDVAVLAVADTGIGVPVEEREHLFRRFYRASNARNSTSTGTGLGLVMIRTIVEAHHGTVHLDTGHAGGSRFVVRLPRHRPAA